MLSDTYEIKNQRQSIRQKEITLWMSLILIWSFVIS